MEPLGNLPDAGWAKGGGGQRYPEFVPSYQAAKITKRGCHAIL